MMMMSSLEHIVACRTMSNVREKSDHVTCTLFDNVTFISNRIDDIIIRICRDMSNDFGCEKKKREVEEDEKCIERKVVRI